MSVVSYNGIALPYAYTSRFNQVAERDDVAQVDYYVTRFEITVQCIINTTFLSYIAPRYALAAPANAADLMRLVRQDLLAHRKDLAFVINGINMIPDKTAGTGTVDAKNGPQPQSCEVMNLGDETFILNYSIVAWYKENPVPVAGVSPTTFNSRTSDVLFNRWSETVEMDENLYTIRIREGMYKIRSDSIGARTADHHRWNMAAVGVPIGFLRLNSKYTISPDGLAIMYRVVDREYFKTPPYPAYKAEGDFTMSMVGPGGAKRFGDVRVRLEGGNWSNQGQLLEKAWKIASQKLIINGAPYDRKNKIFSTMVNGYIKTGMWENYVEIVLRAMLMADKAKVERNGSTLWLHTEKGATQAEKRASFVSALVATPRCDWTKNSDGSDKPPLESTPFYFSRGSAGWLLKAAAYFDPRLNDAIALGPSTDEAPLGDNGVISTVPQQLTGGPSIRLVGEAGRLPET